MAYSAVRVEKLKVTSQFQSIDLHGRRLDASSERRADRARTANSLSWSKGENSLDVMGALAARKAELGGAKQYGKAAMGAHFLLTVSPSWIAEAGDIHDPKNPRNQKLFEEAKVWAETHLGKGSVIAMRMDMDEAGGGVVDVVAVPSMTKKVGGKEVSYVSLNRAFEKAFGKGRKNYVGMQDSWAKHCQKTLDPEIKRGVSKEITQKEHVHAEIIAPALKKRDALTKAVRTANARYAKREKDVSDREKAVVEREKAAEAVIAGRWWSKAPREAEMAVLVNRETQWHRDKYESVIVKLGNVSTRLTQEREKREALERKNRETLNALNDANAKINALEVAVAEIAEQIPKNAFLRLKMAIGRSKMLDDVMQYLGIRSNSEQKQNKFEIT